MKLESFIQLMLWLFIVATLVTSFGEAVGDKALVFRGRAVVFLTILGTFIFIGVGIIWHVWYEATKLWILDESKKVFLDRKTKEPMFHFGEDNTICDAATGDVLCVFDSNRSAYTRTDGNVTDFDMLAKEWLKRKHANDAMT